jgi:mercuric reductase
MDASEQKISAAVERLNHILPLSARQQALDAPVRQLHQAILYGFIELGHSLTKAEMAQQVDDVEQAVDALKHSGLVLFDEQNEITGAYPFTLEAREHTVKVSGWTAHCMCALDALAVSPMFSQPSEIYSRCRLTQQPIHLQQLGLLINNEDEVSDVFFAIDWNAASTDTCCADSLCTEMIFIKGEPLARHWCDQGAQRQIFSLTEAMDFAARFFCPLLKT